MIFLMLTIFSCNWRIFSFSFCLAYSEMTIRGRNKTHANMIYDQTYVAVVTSDQ